MKRGPKNGAQTAQMSAVDKATLAWGDPLPTEVLELALACDASTASAVATRLGYSPAVISNILAQKYPGDVTRVFEKIRGALMNETVECPILGEIGRHRCLDEQGRPFFASNSIRARLFHACRTCPQNRKTRGAV